MASGKDDIFGFFGVKDKLDGFNDLMWSFMTKHVLVAQNLWNIVSGSEPRPIKAFADNNLQIKAASTKSDHERRGQEGA